MASSVQMFVLLSLTSGLFIAGAMSEETVPACPPGWTQFGSRCFIFHRSAKRWVDAESHCIKIGGNLASIHSSEENYFLNNLIARVTNNAHLRTWIGGYDAVQEGKWLWSDGTRFDYLRWGPGEPNNLGTEHCIVMNWAGSYWNDIRCYYHFPYVCAKDVQTDPE
ncbi:galactose-specific lectin nattectin-like isoform X2 [Notolabrus celidotus]|nr:galactose-specific lectin nattectin-like isoform X2 [Notolabrus celidotus]XP_034551048.1 galactose-specific lectin nattectin-like isoform X2 [Notolabrus celidotus]